MSLLAARSHFRISPSSVWALARITLLEAARRKVFAILLLFGAALLSSTLFFPSIEIEGRLRLTEVWSLRASAVFTAIVGLFLAGFSIPSDVEQKRIYLLISKPVAKPALFLGRFVGYALLLAVFIACMGVLTIGFLRSVQFFSGPSFPPLAAYPRVEASAFDAPGGDIVEGATGASLVVGPGQTSALRWTWPGLRRADFPDQVRIQARLFFSAVDDPFRFAGTALFLASGPKGEHRATLAMNTNEEREFVFPASLLDGDGALTVEVRAGDADGRIAADREWMQLYQRSQPFELAFARGLGLVLLQSLTVLSLTLMASTFLSAPLSILLGILLYIVGSVHGYVREGTRDIDRSLSEIKTSGAKHKTMHDLPPAILRASTFLNSIVLSTVPDFDQFDYSHWLLKDHAVSWREMGTAAGKALRLIVPLVVLGVLVMSFKDFG